MQSIQVTRSGIAGIVYNGISDWVYEGKFSFPCFIEIHIYVFTHSSIITEA